MEDAALADLQVERTGEHVYSVEVLKRLAVPASAIRVLPDRDANTADEIRTIERELRAERANRVILVTSKYHSRRVRAIWRALVGSEPHAIVRYASGDPFEPEHWWRTTADAMAVSREWFGLLNAWAGFPVASTRGQESN